MCDRVKIFLLNAPQSLGGPQMSQLIRVFKRNKIIIIIWPYHIYNLELGPRAVIGDECKVIKNYILALSRIKKYT